MTEVKKIYIAHFLIGFGGAVTIITPLYLLSHGITQSQIALLFAVFMIVMALLDIPTGSFADIFGHKASVGLGLFFHAFYGLFFFLFPTLWGFLSAMVIAGIGLALVNGAFSSLIYDILQKAEKQKDFQKIKGKSDALLISAAIVASPLGSLMYKYYPSIPYLIFFFCFVTASLMILSIRWEFTKQSHTVSSFFNKIKMGTALTMKNNRLVAIVLIGIVLTTNRILFNQNISQPYLVQIGIDVGFVGFIAAAIAIVMAVTSANAYKVSKKIGPTNSLFLIVLISTVSAMVLSSIHTVLAITIILFLYMGHAFREPVFGHIAQEEVSQEHRATMVSTTSFLTNIVIGLTLPVWGKGIDIYGIRIILLVLAVFTGVIGIVGIYIFGLNNK